jgi:trk system potassium uptake protein TrkH
MMTHIRNVALIWGVLSLGLAALAFFHMLASHLLIHDGAGEGFAACVLISGFVGGVLTLVGLGERATLGFRGAVILTLGAWFGLPLLMAIPLHEEAVGLSITDAIFETVSGLTTTGSTVISHLEAQPPTLLVWRALLQWIGGIGIIGLSIAILPLLRSGGMQLFHLESSDRSPEKLIARPGHLAGVIAGLYLGLTCLCALGYVFTGMSGFDAILHALTTVSTGGYSTTDQSMGGFSAGSQWVAIVFMLAGAVPFLAYVRAVSRHEGRRPGAFEEIVGLLVIVVLASSLLFAAELGGPPDHPDAVRLAIFNTVSVLTTTGYAAGDYQLWGPLAMTTIFILTFLGGCAGSTAGGFKVFRIQIMLKSTWASLQAASSPHAITVARHAGRRLTASDSASVALFAGLYVACFAIGAVALSAFGLDFLTAVTASATAMANVGPGLGDVIGPAGNFASLPDPAKWLLCVQMLLGRLEILVALYVFTPRFWMR